MRSPPTTVLDIALRDALREELGQTYTVSVGLSQPLPQRGAGQIQVQFGAVAGKCRGHDGSRPRRDQAAAGRTDPRPISPTGPRNRRGAHTKHRCGKMATGCAG